MVHSIRNSSVTPPWVISSSRIRLDTSITFRDRMQALRSMRQEALEQHSFRPNILIVGAGPAGLILGIHSLIHGNPIKIVEKRKEQDQRRENAVELTKHTVNTLKFYGIYSYLLEQGLIYPCGHDDDLIVRLMDLEIAMKAIIAELSSEQVIYYDSVATECLCSPKEGELPPEDHYFQTKIIHNSDGEETLFNNIQLVVYAQGARAPVPRITVLPPVPVITAIFKDDRPKVFSLSTLPKYVSRSLSYSASAIYYYGLLFFKTIFQKELTFDENCRIAGVAVLHTPRQNYLGCSFSKEESERMMGIYKRLQDAKTARDQASTEGRPDVTDLQTTLDEIQSEWDKYMQYWCNLSFCYENIQNLYQLIGDFGKNGNTLNPWLPLHHFSVAKIGADRAEKLSKEHGKSVVILAGDAAATVDPSTGRGCNTAIRNVIEFHKVLESVNDGDNRRSSAFRSFIIRSYEERMGYIIHGNHLYSRKLRESYRPDALDP